MESVNLQLRREKQRKGIEKKQSDTDTAIQFDFHLRNDDAEKLAHEMVAQGRYPLSGYGFLHSSTLLIQDSTLFVCV